MGLSNWFNNFLGSGRSGGGISNISKPTIAGVEVNPTSANSVSAYYSAIRNISEDIGKIPTYVYKDLKEKGKERQRANTVDKIFTKKPNEEMTPMVFKETIQSNCLGWGNGYAEIIRNRRNEVIHLLPIHPARVEVRRDVDGKLFYRVYPRAELTTIYSFERRGAPVDLMPEDMFHLKDLGIDGAVGIGKLEYAGESVGSAIASQQFSSAFFGNGAHSGVAIKHPQSIGDEARESLERSYNSIRQGSANAHKAIVLEEGMDVTTLTVDPKKAMVIETRQFSVTEIARWFRIPPDKIGDLTHATFSNIEQMNINYVTETLLSWVVKWEQEINAKLLSKEDNFSKFDMNMLLRGDSTARADYYGKMFNIGAKSINEIRELEDDNPIGEEGDGHYVQVNMALAGDTEYEDGEKPIEPVQRKEEDVPTEEVDTKAFEPIVKKAVLVINNKERNAESRNKKLDMDAQCLYAFQTLTPILETIQTISKTNGTEKIGAFFKSLEKYYADNNRLIDDSKLMEIFFNNADNE